MRILLTNDDGVHAQGIRTLKKCLDGVAEILVVAPLEERSTTGHSLSLLSPLRLSEIDNNIYGCSGFPADCVLMGIGHLWKDKRPDLVISGINRGANLGQDLFYSGTVAAAREASFHDIPAIAVSTVTKFTAMVDDEIIYETAGKFVRELVELKIHKSIPSRVVLNVNVPNLHTDAVQGVKLTRIGFRKYSEDISARQDLRKGMYYWVAGAYQGFIQGKDTDCHTVEEGNISVTPHDFFQAYKNMEGELGPYIKQLDQSYRK